MWVAVARAGLESEGNRGEGKGGKSGDRAPCHCLDDAASTMRSLDDAASATMQTEKK